MATDLLLKAQPAPSYSSKPDGRAGRLQPLPRRSQRHRSLDRSRTLGNASDDNDVGGGATVDLLLPRRARMSNGNNNNNNNNNNNKGRVKRRNAATPDSPGSQRRNRGPRAGPASPSDQRDDGRSGAARTVFYSLRQTGSLQECGLQVPGAPPATPLPAELPPGLKFVLSLQDTRSKRELSIRLTEIKEKQKDAVKQSELKAQIVEREREQERITQLRADQRSRIYALNQLMTELEFRDFQVYRSSRDAN